MTYDVYYLIYGIKLSDEFIRKLIDYVVESGDFDLELVEETCLEDGYDWEKVKKTSRRYEYIDEDFLENYFFEMLNSFYDGDSYIGKQVWSTEDCNWNEIAPADGFPVAEISEDEKVECKKLIDSFVDLLPVELVQELPDANFYWCVGSS